ncbi:hypothetical protein I3271_05695 [Photobacterium leiognathi]|uniref:hypothetical protein n=1 Tax=Photobacterium leiognathi TaxID=553611 RepID=UPI001EE08897|nr:hypothetical protein [Photobacterium leiognathi]MCG3884175.1 hypothetical protein [Photobacterium leiognathi]
MKLTDTELDREIGRLNSVISDENLSFADKERAIDLALESTNDEYQQHCIAMLHERLINEFGDF